MSAPIPPSLPSFLTLPDTTTLNAIVSAQAFGPELEGDIACLSALLNAAGINVAVMANGNCEFTSSFEVPRPADRAQVARYDEIGLRHQQLIGALYTPGIDLTNDDLQNIHLSSLIVGQLLEQMDTLNQDTQSVIFGIADPEIQQRVAAQTALKKIEAFRIQIQKDRDSLIALIRSNGLEPAKQEEGYTLTQTGPSPISIDPALLARYDLIGATIAPFLGSILEEVYDYRSNPTLEILQELHQTGEAQQDIDAILSALREVLAQQPQAPVDEEVPIIPVVDMATARRHNTKHEEDVTCMINLLRAAGIDVVQEEDGTPVFTETDRAVEAAHEYDMLRYVDILVRLKDFYTALPEGIEETPEVQRIGMNAAILEQLCQKFDSLPEPVIKQLTTITGIAISTPLDLEHDDDMDCMQRILSAAGINISENEDGSLIHSPSNNDVEMTHPDDAARYEDILIRLDAIKAYLAPQSVDMENGKVQKILKRASALTELVNLFHKVPYLVYSTVLGRVE